MENIINLIRRIISLPIDFSRTETKSLYDLLKDTGYFEKYSEILEYDIAKALEESPILIDKWFEWSENKRSSDGWYVIKKVDGKFEVGEINKNGIKEQFLELLDKRIACAVFIKKEIEDMRSY